MLSELRALREQHFASSSSGCDVNSLAFKPQEAQGDDPQSPSLAGMGSSSLFTLSPPSTAAGVRNARQPFRRRSDVEAAEPPVPDSAESPAESTASVPQRSSAWENRSSGAAAGAELPSLRPTSVAAPGMAMSTLVAGILGRLSSGVRQTAPEGTERQLQGGTGGQADDVRRGRGAGEWSARVPAGGAMSFSGAAPVDAAGKGESRCTTEESPRYCRPLLDGLASPSWAPGCRSFVADAALCLLGSSRYPSSQHIGTPILKRRARTSKSIAARRFFRFQVHSMWSQRCLFTRSLPLPPVPCQSARPLLVWSRVAPLQGQPSPARGTRVLQALRALLLWRHHCVVAGRGWD